MIQIRAEALRIKGTGCDNVGIGLSGQRAHIENKYRYASANDGKPYCGLFCLAP